MWNKQYFNQSWVDMVHQIATSYKDEPGEVEIASTGTDHYKERGPSGNENYLQRWIPTKKHKLLLEQFNEIVFRANRDLYGYDIWYYVDTLQYTTYKSECLGEFPSHTDSFLFGKASTQKLSVVVGLTNKDEYEGGVFEINSFKNPIQYKLTAGQVLIFPSMLSHRVTPVTKGIRQTLVTWYSGPMWR